MLSNSAPYNEYLIYAKVIDQFAAYRNLKGSGNVNLDIAQFCDMIQFKLIDIFGEERKDGGATV